MSRDNWERLVVAVLRREQLWQLFHQNSTSPSISSISSDYCHSLSRQISIGGFPSHSDTDSHHKEVKNIDNNLVLGDADYRTQDTAYLANVVRKKLQNLPSNVRKLVDLLRRIQAEHDDLKTKLWRERAALEAKYQKLYLPLYTMRSQIINSVVQVEGSTISLNPRNQVNEDGNEKGIPDFWLTAIKNNKVLAGDVSANDEEALKFLQDIKPSKIDNRKGFRLQLHFGSNPFFKNSVLTKTYQTVDEDESVLEKAIGTEIEWFPGKNLTHKIKTKNPKKWSKIVSLIARTEQCESFFNFFSPPQVPDDKYLDEDAAEKFQNLMAKDYEMGLIIRDKIIPHAVAWFVGEAAT